MKIHFDPLIKKKQAITYIDDRVMQSKNKDEMFAVIGHQRVAYLSEKGRATSGSRQNILLPKKS